MNIQQTLDRYERELTQSVIPFWQTRGEDRVNGGYFTSLDRDGTVFDTLKYMWVQWRIVYMFATLYDTPYRQDEWLAIARRGFDFLTRHGKDSNGNYYFAVNREGQPAIAPYSVYSEAFAAMGAAALYKVTNEDVYRREAESAMANYARRMDNPKGRWEKSLSGRGERLSLGHFMIFANLATVMKDCLGTEEYESAADNATQTVMDSFWHPELKVLFENINKDKTFDLDSSEGRQVNPGHGLEALWFIARRAELAGDMALARRAADMILGVLDFSWDKHYGGVYYFMDALGKPHLELQADMKLWWPHCEALVATALAYKLTGDSIFMDWFERLDDWAWRRFPDPEYGEWYGYLNREGHPTHSLKGGKWKTFFHLPRCLLEVINILRRCG